MSRLSIDNYSKNDELEQYGKRLCLPVDGIPTENNESSDNVINLTKLLFKEAKVSVTENLLDCAHRINPIHTNRVS